MALEFFDTFAQVEPYVREVARLRRFTNNDKSFIIKIQFRKQSNGHTTWKVEDKRVIEYS